MKGRRVGKKKKIKWFPRLLPVAAVFTVISAAGWIFLNPPVRGHKEVKREKPPVPVVRTAPSGEMTFYRNLKEKEENGVKKEQFVGLMPPSRLPQEEVRPEGPLSPRFTLQVASLKDRKKAAALSEHLVREGFPSYIISTDIPEKGLYYRVRIGHYRSRKLAEEALVNRESKIDYAAAQAELSVAVAQLAAIARLRQKR